MFAANATTAFVACRAVLPAMIARRSGSIVNFASTAGEYGSISPAAHYAAAKGAVIAMTKSLAREASPHKVRVNAISPGPTDTVALGAATPSRRRPPARGRFQPPRPARRDRRELRLPRVRHVLVRDRDRPPGQRRLAAVAKRSSHRRRPGGAGGCASTCVADERSHGGVEARGVVPEGRVTRLR